MLDEALQLAGRGWRIFPVHTTVSGACSCGRACGKDAGKHPRIKAWQKEASTDAGKIHRWWKRWPQANIGLATGQGLVVVDIDGPDELATLQAAVTRYGPLPAASTVRTGRGMHLYFKGAIGGSRKIGGLLFRGDGGFGSAPPSLQGPGRRYRWIKQGPLPELPHWINDWAQSVENKPITVIKTVTDSFEALGARPAYLKQVNAAALQHASNDFSSAVATRAAAALATLWTATEEARIRSALAAIPADCERDPWLHIGMALHGLSWQRPDGTDAGFEIWEQWSATGKTKYQGLSDLETRWRSFGKPGRAQVTLGTLYHYAAQHGWQAPAAKEVMPHDPKSVNTVEMSPHSEPPPGGAFFKETNGHTLPAHMTAPSNAQSPLIELNSKYAVIGDVGGKCLVLGWVRSKVDETIQVPSFQSFKTFTERYSNRYIQHNRLKGGQWVDEMAPLGASWLNWSRRTSYEGIDLIPDGAHILPGNVLNLWQGFAVTPKQGSWELMRRHIAKILARSDIAAMEYIVKWAAWKVQHPGERAEVALVFKGAKGSGKGTFANALRRMFGQHGLQIFNSKHLVGQFNSHQRNCLLLFADEAFWAGDKQGESVLKGMLTEPALMIEQKGIDATPWKNRLGVIMATNAEWVVPASHDERRYAVFDVSSERLKNEQYFKALHDEINNGGLEAMLYDLQKIDLKNWHPRKVPQTEALQEQKLRSLDPRYEWFEGLLSDGILWGAQKDSYTVSAGFLLNHAREAVPRLRDISSTALGRFLADMGCEKVHADKGNLWRFEDLAEHRQKWTKRFGNWKWQRAENKWVVK